MVTDKKIFLFYIFLLIMLTNGILFNFIFKMMGFSMWRQLFFVVGFLIFFHYVNFNNALKQNSSIITKNFFFSLITLFFLSFITFSFSGYNLVRIVYEISFYLYGYILIPLAYYVQKYHKTFQFYKFFHYLGLFISVGIIVDSIVPISFIFHENPIIALQEREVLGRVSFLSENPTTIGLILNFMLTCSVFYFYLQKKWIKKIVSLFVLIIYLYASFCTGSRQILFIMFVSSIIMGFFIFFVNPRTKDSLILIFIIIGSVFFLSHVLNSLFNNVDEKILERFSIENIEEDTRSDLWKEGLQQFSIDNSRYWFIGHGLGSTQTTQAYMKPNEYSHIHYENTYFAKFHDIGFVSFYFLLWPIFYIFKKVVFKKKSCLKYLFYSNIFAYLFISYISPNGSAYTSQVTLFILVSMVIYYSKFNIISLKNEK
jgi:hypothetical protein